LTVNSDAGETGWKSTGALSMGSNVESKAWQGVIVNLKDLLIGFVFEQNIKFK
jgi:hypothetical protein